jgi:starch phosphorylase
VGLQNFFLFGLTADEVQAKQREGYDPMQYVESNIELREILDLVGRGTFSNGNPDLFKPLLDTLTYHDEYMLMADYQSYIDCQGRVDAAYRDQELWTKMSILNVARIGRFSSDRSIHDYAEKIWDVKPVKVQIG